jgi:hypothetical protein
MFISVYLIAGLVGALIVSILVLARTNSARKAANVKLDAIRAAQLSIQANFENTSVALVALQSHVSALFEADSTAEGLIAAAEAAVAELLKRADNAAAECGSDADIEAVRRLEAADVESLTRITDAEDAADALLNSAAVTKQDYEFKLQALDDRAVAMEFSEKSAELLIAEAEDKAQKIINNAVVAAEVIMEDMNSQIASIVQKANADVACVTDGVARSFDGLQAEINRKNTEIEHARQDYVEKKSVYDRLVGEIAVFDERLAFAEMGIYEPHFNFNDSEDFKAAIERVRSEQKDMVSAQTAATCETKWTIDGSLAKGTANTKRGVKLTLRAFNGECEAAISNARWNNVNAMLKRIENARQRIDKLNVSTHIALSNDYYDLKVLELRLVHEYREKQKAEREARSEQTRAAREEQTLIREMEEAEREEARYQVLLERAKREAVGAEGLKLEAYAQQIALLEKTVADAHAKVVRAQSMAEMTRSGWVYIISNVGSFGPDTVKIGLTRRLDPTDRVRELGAANVPFLFDTHAMIYSDEAPALERALHLEFSDHRVNASNMRKEFFRVSIDDVEAAVKRLAPGASFFKDIEAQEYHETLSLRNARLQEYVFRQSIVFPEAL